MSRFFTNSTAISALLGFGLVAPAMAQDSDAVPLLSAQLQAELAAGLDASQLTCLDGAASPCADGVPLMSPAGVAVLVNESGEITPASAEMQPFAINAEGQPVLRGGDLDVLGQTYLDRARLASAGLAGTAAAAPLAEAEAEPIPAAEAPTVDAPAEAPAAEEPAMEAPATEAPESEAATIEAPAVEAAPEASSTEPRSHEETVADDLEVMKRAAEDPVAEPSPTEEDAKAAAEPAPEPASPADPEPAEDAAEPPAPETPDPETAPADQDADAAPQDTPATETGAADTPPASEDLAKQDELAELLATASDETDAAAAPESEAEAEQPALSDSHAGKEPRLSADAASAAEIERVAGMPLLNAVLQDEIKSGLTADGLLCQDGSPRPCAEGVILVSPKGVSAEIADGGRIVIGPMSAQQYVVGEDGALRARGSNTAAAKEAAEAAAPTAEALNGDAAAQPEAETVKETIAAEGTRRSDQDFETDLADAIAQANALQKDDAAAASADKNDTESDLTKLALAGLGALAVGQFLSEDRQVALNTGDRVIVTRADGSQQVLKDDNTLLRQPGSEVSTQNFADGSSRSVLKRADGSQIITIRGADLSVLRRIHVAPDGSETVLIDESAPVEPVQIASLPPAPKPVAAPVNEAELRTALAREANVGRHFTLGQIRSIPEVRNLVAPVDIQAITFDTGSAAINPDQARQLATLGTVLEGAIKANPREIFLIEGHTDAVGNATYNLALSDRRAESVALALSEYFAVPPENMIVQGYGEEYLKVPTLSAERQNRRASVRRITDLLASAQ